MWFIVIAVAAAILFVMFLAVVSRYKRCSSDQILVVFGKIGKGGSSKCIHGGAAFVWPIIQDYCFLSLRPFQIDVPLQKALSRQNIRVSVPSNFTVGISTNPAVVTAAAERLLGMNSNELETVVREIIFGQLRLVVATMNIEEINSDRDKFLENIAKNVETEIEKIGLKLINVNVTDIQDESGYIESLGKRAAAEAINKAKVDVAGMTRDGEIGQADAQREQRVQVADATAQAIKGENTAKIVVANSNAELREKSAEAERLAVAAENVQKAKALEESYSAQKQAELVRADRERATQEADVVVKAEIGKRTIEIAAEAEAEKRRREAKGEADAIFLRMDAQARGIKEILAKQAEGLTEVVKAAGGDPQKAAMLLIVDKLPEMIKTQVEAIKGIKIDKVVVWDGMTGNKPTTANFLSGMLGSVPPLQDLFKTAGMNLPDFLGTPVGAPKSGPVAPVPEVKK